jgi:hypothetical protein
MDKSYGDKKRKLLCKNKHLNEQQGYRKKIYHSNKHKIARKYSKSYLGSNKHDINKLHDFIYPRFFSKCDTY